MAESVARVGPGLGVVVGWELRKLLALQRVRLALGVSALGPLVFALAVGAQDGVPKDTVYGRWVHSSGFAIPLVVLGFAGQWLFPLLASLVAGDIFAQEDHHGTWGTLLTRSTSRARVFNGKVLAAAVFSAATVTVLALSSLAAGLVTVGDQPLVSLSGVLLGPGRLTLLTLASWALMLLPVAGFTALGVLLSVATRNPAAGVAGPVVIGLLMQLTALLPSVDPLRRVLLTTPFDAWHGLLVSPSYNGPVIQGAVISLLWTVGCLTVARRLLMARDMTGS